MTEVPHLYDREHIGSWLNALGLTNEGAEIGVAYGGYSRIILKEWAGKRLYLIDLWEQQDPRDYRERTNQDNHFSEWFDEVRALAASDERIRIHVGYSHLVADYFTNESLDFVYIDANHAYEWVMRDMDSWWPKVRYGGVMLGHDYCDDTTPPNYMEVKSAVDDWALNNPVKMGIPKLTMDGTTWYFHKDK